MARVDDGNLKTLKNQRVEKVKLGPNTLATDCAPPDGGWGWMIVLASGFSQFCLMAVQQSFGLLFRERFQQLDISSSQMTVIVNVNLAMISCIGLANGPIFKKFSFRKVGFVGALTVAIALSVLSVMTTFTGILICLSVFYAGGLGIAMSANALALNTYFKKKRRIAVGLSWTCTGLGPIIMPQVITILLPLYGVSGTVLLYGGFALNAVACALLLQPVRWHAKKISLFDEIASETVKDKEDGILTTEKPVQITKSSDNISRVNRLSAKFGSQYLYYNDKDEGAAGIDVIPNPGTPMMSRANDGWFSNNLHKSSTSLSSIAKSRRVSLNLSKAPSFQALASRGNSLKNLAKQINDADGRKRKFSSSVILPLIPDREPPDQGNENLESKMLKEITDEEAASMEDKKMSCLAKFWAAFVVFFDLDLLRDLTYINLMLGINFANFTEMNFALLTPFILAEYGLKKVQVATVMSILGGMDVIARLSVPFIATKLDWSNRTFFLIGIGCMATGRIILAHVSSFNVIIAIGALIGFGKALRTIFMALVIPAHIPLSRLPAATGLQLLTSGIISIALGPVVGWLKDVSGSFSNLLHILNILSYLTIISWTLEMWLTARRNSKINNCKNSSLVN